MHNKLIIQHGLKPSTRQYFHNPQVTYWLIYSFSNLAIYGMLLFLNLLVLHFNSSTLFCFLLVFINFCLIVKKEFSLLRFLFAKFLQSFSRLIINVLDELNKLENKNDKNQFFSVKLRFCELILSAKFLVCSIHPSGGCPSLGWWVTILRMVGDHP